MENQEKSTSKVKSLFAAIMIPVAYITSLLLYMYVLGYEGNFEDNDPSKHPLPGNYLGLVHKGGIIVPFLMSFFLMVLIFSVERMITITKAYGRGSVDSFVRKIKSLLSSNNMEAALDECERQKGSVGNVAKEVLLKYKQMTNETHLSKEQKILSIQKELEEATSLELPMLEKNLTVLATLASVSTLVGLLGTVIGMIKAFAALAVAGGGSDAVALANGISEALINTALGILSSALAIIAYNYFTSKIDTLTYSIDEIGFSITQNFSTTQKETSNLRETSNSKETSMAV